MVAEKTATVGMKQNLPGGDSAVVPPDPMPNSAVKRRSADGSVGSPHVRVGNCQASNTDHRGDVDDQAVETVRSMNPYWVHKLPGIR